MNRTSNRKILPCRKCGRPVSAAAEALAVVCDRCLVRVAVSAKANGSGTERTPKKGDLARCCNFAGDVCVVLDGRPCVVKAGGSCSWFSRAVAPTSGQGRLCVKCGAAIGRGRVCPGCKRAANRARQRAWRQAGVTRRHTQTVPEAHGTALEAAETGAGAGNDPT